MRTNKYRAFLNIINSSPEFNMKNIQSYMRSGGDFITIIVLICAFLFNTQNSYSQPNDTNSNFEYQHHCLDFVLLLL